MLSRVSRLAAVLIVAQAGMALGKPTIAQAAKLDCGDSGPHICCIEEDSCATKIYCCAIGYDDDMECDCSGIE
jgi:hypothetical protein